MVNNIFSFTRHCWPRLCLREWAAGVVVCEHCTRLDTTRCNWGWRINRPQLHHVLNLVRDYFCHAAALWRGFYYLFSLFFLPLFMSHFFFLMSSIHLSKQSCWSYHYVLGAAGFNSGSRPHRDNDVCFVCSVNPPFNTPHAPFNRVLLSSVLTTSSPQPFRSSLNLFLWITERVLFPPPPLHSTEVAGRNYCLFKYKLKCWPPRGMGFQ